MKTYGHWNPENLKKLNDEEFIEIFCLGTEDRTNIDFKAFNYVNQKKYGAPPEAIDNLLAEAKRRKIPLSVVATRFAQRAFSGSSFVSNLCAPKTWRKYEIHAAGAIIRLLQSENLSLDSIKFDARVLGIITGSERQIDLFIKKETPKKHNVACEIKNLGSTRVPVEKVEAFVTKMRDVGADHGVMISPNGFQQAAIKTAIQNKITLFTLRELLGKDVPLELKSVGHVNETQTYWVLELDEKKWIFAGQLTSDRPTKRLDP